MVTAIFAFIGFGCGVLATMIALDAKRKCLDKAKAENNARIAEHEQNVAELRNRHVSFVEDMQQERALLTKQLQERLDKIHAFEATLSDQAKKLNAARKEFDAQVISHKELQEENEGLKQTLRNLCINIRKLELDRTLQQETQAHLDEKVRELGSRYLHENVKWISRSLNADNFSICKQRLLDVIERCRRIGLLIAEEEEKAYFDELRAEYERVVRAALEREEQARIKAQIREERKVEQELRREQERIAREKAAVEAALAEALASTIDQHSAEIESLKARLAEAEANERAISQAQLTKAGFVYVISNIGSFGENVFKIGMTRRLDPEDRIRELSGASVPFPFDVHMMISCANAPSLEHALHKALLKQQLNKTNPRKEFFHVDIETIVRLVKENHGEVEYIADPEALQYRQSSSMSDEDMEFIDHVFEDLDDDDEEMDDLTTPIKLPHESTSAPA